MSRKKIQFDVDFDLILGRLKSLLGVSTDKDIAELLGITAQNLSNKKRSGWLLVELHRFALNKKLNPGWLFTGEGNPYIIEQKLDDTVGVSDELQIEIRGPDGEIKESGAVEEIRAPVYNKDRVGPLDDDPVINELLEGTRKVLKSGNRVAFEALERNIRYFSLAVETERRLQSMETRLERLEKERAGKCDKDSDEGCKKSAAG